MQVLNLIKTLSDKGKLNKELSSINERSIDRAKNSGRGAQIGAFNFEERDLFGSTFTPKSVQPVGDGFIGSDVILSQTTYIKNPLTSTKIPFVSGGNVEWKQVGFNVDLNPTITSKEMTPYRLTTSCHISKMLLNQNEAFEDQIKGIILKAIQDKLISTIFSSVAKSDDNPKGLLSGTPETLTSIDDAIDMMVNLDKKQSKNTLLISPTAKQKLIKLSQDYSILDHETLFGADYICDSRIEDEYLIYIDLSKLAVCQFDNFSIDADGFTDAMNGNVILSINAFFDFGMIDDSYIKVGKF